MSREQGYPLIFNIRHFSLDDGPGIRSTVFLKGCPLSCIWCHNPESMSREPEIAFHAQRCIRCGDCSAVCEERAIDLSCEERVVRDRCTACGKCADACPSLALSRVGEYYSPDDLAVLLLKDRIFYQTSGGGVTFSGGEPVLHAEYLEAVMKQLKQEDIHIAVQTSGMFDMATFRSRLLPYIDLIYYDIKLFDTKRHREYTGMDNTGILDNFSQLLRAGTALIPRVPLIPGITDTEENLTHIAGFLKDAGCNVCELLPYNPGAVAKRTAIGMRVSERLPERMPGIEEEQRLKLFFQKLQVRIPASTTPVGHHS